MGVKHAKKSERKFSFTKKQIIISSVIAAVVVIGVVIAVLFTVFSNSDIPNESLILSDLNKDSAVTNLKVGKTTLEFKAKSFDIDFVNENEDKTQCVIEGSLIRNSDIYETSKVDYTVTYIKESGEYFYSTAKQKDDSVVTFKAIKGYFTDEAKKIVTDKYKCGEFLKQDTDLEKGTDKIWFKVESDEYDGKVFVLYKFSETNGWEYKKINEDELGFKPGVSHKEDGLYTNTNIKNIMFFGIDAEGYGGRSDCMMLVSIDSNTSKIKLTSFMRDTYVTIPGRGGNKLNSAYAIGGPELAVSAIESTYGIKIDNYIATNFTTFKNIINAIGGVNVNISSDEAGYINWQLNSNGQTNVGLVPSGGGNVTLNGQQALWLCRNRGGNGFSGNDFVRTSRQRRVIQSLISRYSNFSASQVLSTIDALDGNFVTDLSASDFSWYAERSSKFFTYDIAERCVPDDGEWYQSYSPAGAWIIAVNDWDYLKDDVQKYIYEDLK